MPRENEATGLIGRSFHIFGDDGKVSRQGTVVAYCEEGYYLIQYFEWIMGEPSTMAVVHLKEMMTSPEQDRQTGSWQFYEDVEQMKYWAETHSKLMG